MFLLFAFPASRHRLPSTPHEVEDTYELYEERVEEDVHIRRFYAKGEGCSLVVHFLK